MNPKEEAKKIADIFKKEEQENEIERRAFAVRRKNADMEAEKRKIKFTKDFLDTGIKVFFEELINQKIVDNSAYIFGPIIDVRALVYEQGEDYHEGAEIKLIFNRKGGGSNNDSEEDQILAIYDSDGLVIKGKEEFHVGMDCSLTEAILSALRKPEHQYNIGSDPR